METNERNPLLPNLLEAAVNSVLASKKAYCKFLSANDSGETGGHQCGILISKRASSMLFDRPLTEKIDRWVSIRWQSALDTRSHFIYYQSKHELRITTFGPHFPYLNPNETGSLFILSEITPDSFSAFILSSDEDIQDFLETMGLTPAETNSMIQTAPETNIESLIRGNLPGCDGDAFPPSEEISDLARTVNESPELSKRKAIEDPDRELVRWINAEYSIFRSLESDKYGKMLKEGFSNIDSFINFANTVLNRRKSRAGKSLEHHLTQLFIYNDLQFDSQPTSEENKTPDFLFPSQKDYQDPSFPEEKLVFLAAKTTCKDRWRQILNEAKRAKTKFLCTLQQGISSNQLAEMKEAEVVLVVPKDYISFYPSEYRDDIWTLKDFIDFVKLLESKE